MSAALGGLEILQAWAGRVVPEAGAGAVDLVGVACSYAPLELLHAAGLTPVRLRAFGPPSPAVDAWLPSFTCSIVRGMLGAALEGRLDSLSAIVLPHTCDSMQELAGIWRTLHPRPPVLVAADPLHVAGPRAPEYLQRELQSLASRLAGELGRQVDDGALARSLALYNRLRRTVARLDTLRNRLSAAEAWAAIAAAWQVPPEAYLAAAETLIGALEPMPPRIAHGPALVLAGSVLDEPLIPALVDSLGLGGRVVGDDLCNGTRDVFTLAGEAGDPWSALVARMLQRAPCPAKHAPTADYAQRLAELAGRRGARGVVQVLVKYCDPLGFDSVAVEQVLASMGCARLLLEVEATNAPEQLRTRLQAFLEMLVWG